MQWVVFYEIDYQNAHAALFKGDGADYMNNDLAEYSSKHRKPITKFWS